MDLKAPKEIAKKTAYVAVGVPVVVGRKVKELGTKLMDSAETQIDEYATEGEKVTKQLRDRDVVEELEQRIHFDKVQERVEGLRDQLENTLNSWRESFISETEKKKTPQQEAPKPAAEKAPAKKAPTKKPAAKKTTSAKKEPAKKAPAKKEPAKASK